jgi:hypothetical protein
MATRCPQHSKWSPQRSVSGPSATRRAKLVATPQTHVLPHASALNLKPCGLSNLTRFIRGPSLRDRGGEQEKKYTQHTCDAARVRADPRSTTIGPRRRQECAEEVSLIIPEQALRRTVGRTLTGAQWPPGDHNTASGRPREVCPARRRPAGEVGGNAAKACFTSRKRSELEAVRHVESDKIRGPSLRDRGGEQERSAGQKTYT